MKKLSHILSIRSLLLMLLFVLSAVFVTAQTPTFSAGFNVYFLGNTYDAGTSATTFTWRVEQTSSLTGLSHMNMANFCLEGSVRDVEYSTDGINWSATTPVYSDGSTPECQSANSLIKFSGKALNNYFKLTLNGRYDAILGEAVLKFGNGNVNTGVGNGFTTTGCSSLQIMVPVKVRRYTTVTVCETTGKTRLSATDGAASYIWTAPDGTQTITTDAFLDIDERPTSSGTYRVVYTNGGCKQQDQTVVVVNPAPANPTVAGAVRCGEGILTLAAQSTTSGAVIDWYAGATGGSTLLESTGSFNTPMITTTTNYYAQARNITTGCVSLERIEGVALINPVPSAIASVSNVRCKNGTDGSVELSVSGGTPAYAYAWSNNTSNATLLNVAAGSYQVVVTDANGCTATAAAVIAEPELLTASAAPSHVSCKGGSDGAVGLSVSGGTEPYSYVWSNGALTQQLSGVVAGTYSVTVTDANGCTATAASVITEPELLTATVAATAVSCKGGSNGSVSLAVNGGTGAYRYIWSNAAVAQQLSGVIAGTYSVTVTDANGCTAAATAVVAEPELLTATATATAVSCKGGSNGSVSLAVNGGTGSYGYAWSNAAATQQLRSVAAGTYSVTVTDANGCTATAATAVTEPELLVVAATAVNVTCNGGSDGSIGLSVTGGTGSYGYAWSNAAATQQINGLVAGTYSVTVTDANGCTASTSALVAEPARIAVSVTGPGSVCAGSAIALTAAGGISYRWSGPDGFSSNLPNPTIPSAQLTNAGIYTATVTDVQGCSNSATVMVAVNECRINAGIYPTEVNCAIFNSGKALMLPTVCLTPKTVSSKTTVFNATPGVFFYYTNIIAPSANFSVYVSQTASGALGGARFSLHQGYAFAFANGCTKIATGAEAATPGDAIINFKNVQPGTVITLAVKYDAKSVVGKPISGTLPSSSSFVARFGSTASAPVIPNTATSVSLSNCNGGTVLNGAPETSVNASVKTEQAIVAEEGPAVQVTAFPNPYVSKISFTLRSAISGIASLELFDMSGRKLAVPFLGTIQAGVPQQVHFIAPATVNGTLIYQFRVGNKSVNGKLMSVR